MPRAPTLQEWVFSFRTFVAGSLALYIAFSLDLQKPYWALLTCYIVSQPYAGMVRSKALYRFVGTFVGAVMMVVLVPNLVDAPELLSLAIALWIAGCLYVALMQEPPRNYVFLLSGYCTALIGFPSVLAPDTVFDTAVARVEEISLGIGCAWLVSELVFPRAIGPQLRDGLSRWLAAAGRMAADVLRGRDAVTNHRRLIADATTLASLRVNAGYDTPELRAADGATGALQDRMRILLPLLSGLTDRLHAVRAAGVDPGPPLRLLADWLAEGPSGRPSSLFGVRAAIEAAKVGPPRQPDPILRASTLGLVETLASTWHDCLVLYAQVMGTTRGRQPARAFRPRLRDPGMAALSAFAAVLTILIICGGWIATGWADGATAALMGSVLCTFFAAMDDPAPAILTFLLWVTLGSGLAGIYLFAVLPGIDGFPLLLFVLAVALLPLGAFMARPLTQGRANAFVFGLAGSLALQSTYAADFGSWVNGTIAQAVGIWVAAATTRLVRSVGSEWSVRRLLARGRADMIRIARGEWRPDGVVFAALMLDRIGAIAPRLTASGHGDGPDEAQAVADLRAGANLIALREAMPGLPAHMREPIDLVLRTVVRHLERGDARALERRIAIAARRLGGCERDEHCVQAAVALDGLRRALLPTVPEPPPVPAAALAPLKSAA